MVVKSQWDKYMDILSICLYPTSFPFLSPFYQLFSSSFCLSLTLLLFSSQPSAAEPLDGEEYLDIIGIMRNQAGRYECKASNDVATPDVKYVNVVVSCK